MPSYYTPAQVENLVPSNLRYATNFSVKRAMEESLAAKSPAAEETFDIFLSYRNADIKLALGIYSDLVRRNYKVYLDQVMDPQLDRDSVTRATAERLRGRLMQSKCVFYIATDDAEGSKWMPWELGFEDGYRGKAAIVPVTNERDFVGREFVSIYPRVEPEPQRLWIFKPDNTLDTSFETWRDRIPDRKCGMPRCPIPYT